MSQDNVTELIKLMKSGNLSKLDKEYVLDELFVAFKNRLNDLIRELHNSNINSKIYLPIIISKSNSFNIYKLVDSLNSLNIDYFKYLSPIINKCDPIMINNLVDSLNNNSKIDYSKYLKLIIGRCNPCMMGTLVELLNTNPKIDYSKHFKLIIEGCAPNIMNSVVDSIAFNKSLTNFKKQLTPRFFNKISNIKNLQRITANVIFGIDTAKFISQVSFLIENIKDPSLSTIDKKKIIYINKLIKKIYTTENKKELYNVFKLVSKSQTSYIHVINTINEKMVSNFYSKNLDFDTHKHKTCLNSKINRDIRCGIEIETADLSKDKILNLQLDKFSYAEDPSISNYNKRTKLVYTDDYYPYTAELVSTIIDPYNKDDISSIYNVCETLKQNGATTNFSCGLHVHVSGNGISEDNPKILDDLLSDMVFMQKILIKKLNIYSSRVSTHTKLIPSEFAGKSLDFIKHCNKDDYSNKYYMLNLLSLNDYNTLEFRLFNLPDVIDTNIILSYADMATSIVNSIRKKGSFYNKIQNFYNLKNVDFNNTELTDFLYNEFLDYIDVSKDNKKILTNMDKIFSFYKAKEPDDPNLTEQIIDFHTPKNKILPTPVNHINIDENTTDIVYSVDKRTLSASRNSTSVYFYPFKDIDTTHKKQLVKPTQKNVFYSKPSEKEPSYLVV